MSVKHIQKYYNEVCKNYHDMQNVLHSMEEEASTGLLPPEALTQLKAMLAPLSDNYQKLSYIMYLLHLPNRKEKHKNYKQNNKEFLRRCNGKTDTYVVQENIDCINKLQEKVNGDSN